MYRIPITSIVSLDAHFSNANTTTMTRIRNYGLGPVFQLGLDVVRPDTGVNPIVVTYNSRSNDGSYTLRTGKTEFDSLYMVGWQSAGCLITGIIPTTADHVTMATPYYKDIVLGTDDGVDPFALLSDAELTALIGQYGMMEPLAGSISGTTVTITSGVRRYNLGRTLGIQYFPTYLR